MTATGEVPPTVGIALRASRGGRARYPDAVALGLLAVVAVGLRAPLLSSHGLYRDDAWPALATRSGLSQSLRIGVTAPGFEMFLRLWVGLSHATVWAQVPALVASVTAVVGVYLVARRIGCRPPAALVAGAVLALSPVSVLYATRLKQYSVETALAVGIVALALWAAREPSALRWAALVAAAAAAGAFSVPLVSVGGLALAWVGWRRWAIARAADDGGGAPVVRTLVGLGAFAVFAAIEALVVLGSVPPSLRRLWTINYVDLSGPGPALISTIRILDAFMAGLVYRHGPTGALMLGAVVVGALAFRRDVGLLVLGPLAAGVALAAAHRAPLGGGRVDEYLYPGVALASAMAVQKVLDLPGLRSIPPMATGAALGCAVVVFAMTAGRAQVRLNPYPGDDMAALQGRLSSQAEPGDGVVVSPFSRYPWALYSRLRPRVVLTRGLPTNVLVISKDPDVLIMPREYVEDGYDASVAVRFAVDRPRVWYVATDTPATDTPLAGQAHERDAEDLLIADGYSVTRSISSFGAHADLLVKEVVA